MMGIRKERSTEQRSKAGDMGQGSFEESQAAGKGPSKSKQGPKKVTLKKRSSSS